MDALEAFFRLVPFLFPLVLLLVTYFIGNAIEKRHFAKIRTRETRYRGFPVMTFPTLPEGWQPSSAGLVSGSVVISVDYFKRFLASLRAIIGGRLRSYEPLLDRARREALLRMTEKAVAQGYDAVVNVRIETSRLASSGAENKGVAGVELLAFGTGVKLVK